jgi:hypothetical protein
VTTPDAEVARLAAEHWGVLSLAELRACGISDKASPRASDEGGFTASIAASTRSATPA